jgi:uncharacterized metal-binding protein
LSDVDKRMNRVISSFLLIFSGIIVAGLLTVWFVGWDEISNQVAVPELLMGSFLFALLTALAIGVFLHHRLDPY